MCESTHPTTKKERKMYYFCRKCSEYDSCHIFVIMTYLIRTYSYSNRRGAYCDTCGDRVTYVCIWYCTSTSTPFILPHTTIRLYSQRAKLEKYLWGINWMRKCRKVPRFLFRTTVLYQMCSFIWCLLRSHQKCSFLSLSLFLVK